MKKLLLPLIFLCSCVPPGQVRQTTDAAVMVDAAFADHSRKWQELFMAGKPSPELIGVVMASADDDRRRFHGLMQALVQNLNSMGAIDPVLFNQQLIALSKEVKSLGGK